MRSWGGLIPAHAGKTIRVVLEVMRVAAHPRSRGENQPTAQGSDRGAGLIPAHAGKTPSADRLVHASRAHPRSRGENLKRATHPRGNVGLIPAHAGKTQSSSAWSGRAWAHPRSRGENHYEYAEPSNIKGSSPLTRGKRACPSDAATARGLIPAHAGKTARSAVPTWGAGAHPRSRGENAVTAGRTSVPTGSSPLTRGKRRVHRQAEALHRLIPAHAGKTMRARSPAARFRAHPRSRGENSVGDFCGCGGEGSSPLTRGKQSAFSSVCLLLGLIPAHAGKTPNHPLCPVSHQAHPRSRGENATCFRDRSIWCGSSPLTRGKHGVYAGRPPRNGLIPAHAGKTLSNSTGGTKRGAHPRSRGENRSMRRRRS